MVKAQMKYTPRFQILGALVVPFLMAGCATVNPRPDFDRTNERVRHALGQGMAYRPNEEAALQARVKELLDGGLRPDEAVEVCLLNNPRLWSELLRVGIGRAEVVQAGLFSNPNLSLSLRWPDGGGLTNLEAGLAQNLADLWQIPHRTRAAERELDRLVLEVAREISVVALGAKTAYFESVSADRQRDIAQENLAITQEALDLAIAKRDAGSGSDVDVNLARSRHVEVELRLQKSALTAVEARAALARLLGMQVSPSELALAGELDDRPTSATTAEHLIDVARSERLDFKAARMLVEAAVSRVALERSRFLRSLELGISTERAERGSRGDRNWLAETAFESLQAGQLSPPSLEPREEQSTDWVVGPTLGVELPIFDQNQAQIAKAMYEYQQALHALDALDRELTQQAWVTFERARIARKNADYYEQTVLPLRRESLTLATEAYRAGQTPLLSVLDAQRDLLEARADYIAVLRDHVLAMTEIERVTGQPLARLLDDSAREP
ncbi:MAG: hypothetical protein AMXMBFR47_22920 [Planctomycetota bacterium]